MIATNIDDADRFLRSLAKADLITRADALEAALAAIEASRAGELEQLRLQLADELARRVALSGALGAEIDAREVLERRLAALEGALAALANPSPAPAITPAPEPSTAPAAEKS